MKIYYFGGTIDMVDMLYENGFDGNLFLAGSKHPDDFVKIARSMDVSKDFKYLVAIRSYTISPQYLTLICESLNEISPNKIEINLISGHTKENEKDVGGIVGSVNDLSLPIDKAKYMIDFLETMQDMNLKRPNLYVSCSSKYTYDIAKKYNYKPILQYSKYFEKEYGDNVDLKDSIVSFGPILKENKEYPDINIFESPDDSGFFTKDSLRSFLNDLKKSGVYGVLLYGWPVETENTKIIDFVKDYTKYTKLDRKRI